MFWDKMYYCQTNRIEIIGNGKKVMTKEYDVFISYSRPDIDIVERIARRLRDEESLIVFLDKWELVGGEQWQGDLSESINQSKSAAIFIGPHGLGKWQNNEIQVAINIATNTNDRFRVVPVLLPGTTPKALSDFLSLYTWVDFRQNVNDQKTFQFLVASIRGETVDREQQARIGQLINVPDKPDYFIERNKELENIKNALLANKVNHIGIIGTGKVGIQGMGGIGKSVLAAALAHDDDIRHTFSDGVIWLALGKTPNIVARQKQLAAALGEHDLAIDDPQQGKSLLGVLLSDRECLVILDDVWEQNHVESFNFLGKNSRQVITTRNSAILHSLNAELHCLDLLNPNMALELLANWAGHSQEDMPDVANQIAKECGYLPLALAMVGALVKHNPESWERALYRLQNANLDRLTRQFPNYPYKNLLGALEASVLALPDNIKPYYESLAVFPEETSIPEQVLQVFWKLKKYDVQDITDIFVARSLARIDEYRNLTLHDLQHDYIKTQCSNSTSLHDKFIDAFEQAYPDGWHTIPFEKPYYFFNHFGYHLQHSTRKEKSKEIANEIITKHHYIDWLSALKFSDFTGHSKKQLARQLITTSFNSNALEMCIIILGKEAKEDARHLLQVEDQHPRVITACLNLLGKEAKEDARRLLQVKNQNSAVITACLNLLGKEAKESARYLLQINNQNVEVIKACLKLLSEEVKEDARRLLHTKDQNPHIITLCLKLLGEEAKEDARRLLQAEDQNPNVIKSCLYLLGKEAKEDARRLLQVNDQNQAVITTCLNLLGEEAKEDAQSLLKVKNQNPRVITACLNLLGEEAKEDAQSLLKVEDQNSRVITKCLYLLGKEAKEDARRLLKVENQYPNVITTCLYLLGKEAKEDARRLLQVKNQNPKVLEACFNLLRKEAKEDARRLLQVEDQNPAVITTCLNLLGKEAKEDARRLLQAENQNPDVIKACLNLLGEEAKEDARRLLQVENRNPELITACLNLLGKEAKEDAQRLLQVNDQNPAVITTCLYLLGKEAKEDAQRLLQVNDQNPAVITTCLYLLGKEAKEDARRLLKVKNQNPKVLETCLNLLGKEAKEDARRLLQAEDQNPDVIKICLNLLGEEAKDNRKTRKLYS
jgi:hypothetical protein